MNRIVIANQRGGVAKTTTTVNLARHFADQAQRVLIIDTDPQGSVGAALGLKCEHNLHSFITKKLAFKECITPAHPNIDVMLSDRETVRTEAILIGETARELAFRTTFPLVDRPYDVVLIDVAPSISMLQSCAMLYAQQLLLPVAMDSLSLQGAVASIETANMVAGLYGIPISTLAMLPVMVDRRLQMTETILDSLRDLSGKYNIPLLSPIRTDAGVTKALRQRNFLADYDPKSKAYEDYTAVGRELTTLLEQQINAKTA
jgi:chromosome partitioning protein